MAAYVGFQATQHHRAMGLGQDYIYAQGLVGATAYTMPQPLSPFNWKVMVLYQDSYYAARVNLVRERPMILPAGESGFFANLRASYLPVTHMQWQQYTRFGKKPKDIVLAQAAWRHPAFAPFRRFAMFPVLYKIDRSQSKLCVWFSDLHFSLVGRVPPFRYGMCRGSSSTSWRLESMP